MNIINLTPHDICILPQSGAELQNQRIIPPSGTIARCDTEEVHCGTIDGIPVYHTTYGQVHGMPEPVKETVYIVSYVVARALASSRHDLVIPAGFERDEKGNIIGCHAFSVLSQPQ